MNNLAYALNTTVYTNVFPTSILASLFMEILMFFLGCFFFFKSYYFRNNYIYQLYYIKKKKLFKQLICISDYNVNIFDFMLRLYYGFFFQNHSLSKYSLVSFPELIPKWSSLMYNFSLNGSPACSCYPTQNPQLRDNVHFSGNHSFIFQ